MVKESKSQANASALLTMVVTLIKSGGPGWGKSEYKNIK